MHRRGSSSKAARIICGAPPFEFLDRAFLPLIRRMGFDVTARLTRHGFYPAGGGMIEVGIGPAGDFQPLILEERGAPISRKAEAVLANLSGTVAERELAALAPALGFAPHELFIRSEPNASGPGNCLMVTFEYGQICEVVTAFGRIGTSAKRSPAKPQARRKPISPATPPSAATWPISSSCLWRSPPADASLPRRPPRTY